MKKTIIKGITCYGDLREDDNIWGAFDGDLEEVIFDGGFKTWTAAVKSICGWCDRNGHDYPVELMGC